MPTPRALRLTVAAVLATLVLTSQAYATSGRVPALTPAAPDGLTRALAAGELSEAQYALERARALFRLDGVRARYGTVRTPGPRDATLVLRDLVVRLQLLSPAERAAARRLLARPTDNPDPGGTTYAAAEAAPYCTTNGCIHYVASTTDAPDPVDANVNGLPDYVEAVGAEFEVVWAKEVVAYGYRPPKSDLNSTNHGPDGRIDVYIADIGADRLYGYCTTDDPNASPAYAFGDVSAYCVVDDDFSPSQFRGAASGIAALQVTLAHEFAHAIQYAYDGLEDWLAVRGHGHVDGGRGLRRRQRQLPVPVRPARSLSPTSHSTSSTTTPEARRLASSTATFIFFRYLSERLHDPSIVRRIWERADRSPTGPNDYSIQAIDNALRSVAGIGFSDAFGAFAAVNAFPASFYEEGGAYPTPPIARRTTPDGETAEAVEAQRDARPPHERVPLAATGSGRQANARLRVKLNLPPRVQGPQATLVVVRASGATALRPGDAQRAGRRVGNRSLRARQGQGGAGRADEREHSLHQLRHHWACPTPATGYRSTTTASTGTPPSSCRQGARLAAERHGPGGPAGLQNRCGRATHASVGSTPAPLRTQKKCK